jgi:hypothetical protein
MSVEEADVGFPRHRGAVSASKGPCLPARGSPSRISIVPRDFALRAGTRTVSTIPVGVRIVAPIGERSMAKDHGPQIKNDAKYEALKRKGMSKTRAAKISNAGTAGSRKGGKRSHGGR